MASAAGDPTCAIAQVRPEYTANLSAGRKITPLATERYDLVSAGTSLSARTGLFSVIRRARPFNVCSTPSAIIATYVGVPDEH
jgi:hypothetical protein